MIAPPLILIDLFLFTLERIGLVGEVLIASMRNLVKKRCFYFSDFSMIKRNGIVSVHKSIFRRGGGGSNVNKKFGRKSKHFLFYYCVYNYLNNNHTKIITPSSDLWCCAKNYQIGK